MPSEARPAGRRAITGPVIATRPTFPPHSFTAVTHYSCKTQRQSTTLTAGSSFGNTGNVNGTLLHKLSVAVKEPTDKQARNAEEEVAGGQEDSERAQTETEEDKQRDRYRKRGETASCVGK